MHKPEEPIEKMETYICLDDLHFFAYHGVSPQENVVGNEYILSLRLGADITRAMETDDVTDTLNYAEVYRVLKEEMEIPSKLLEHVGGRLVRRLFREFPTLEHIDLKIAKRNPPMGADIASAGVEIHCLRSEIFFSTN